MPKVSVNILTKDRAGLLSRALASVKAQSFKDFEIIIVSDGSASTIREEEIFNELVEAGVNINVIFHNKSLGITLSRNEALGKSKGEYIAVLDDDDVWIDGDKLKNQVKYLNENPNVVLIGGAIKSGVVKFRPETDQEIRKTMLLRNNFFTSTVIFRREEAINAGGFVKDSDDLAEDYDLWLRLGKIGKMYNFQEVFTSYTPPSYNRERFKAFLAKQLHLIEANRASYPYYWLSVIILRLRLLF